MSRRSQRRAEEAAKAAAEARKAAEARASESSDGTETVDSGEVETSEQDAPHYNVRTRNEPREKAMQEIEKRDLERRGMAQPEPEPEPEKPSAEEAAPEPGPDEQPPEAAPEQSGEVTEPAAEEQPDVRTKQVVNGQEFFPSKQEIDEAGGDRMWRLQKAAELHLEETKQAKAESKRMVDQLAAFLKESAPPAAAAEAKDTSKVIAEKLDVIRYGTPEEGAAALEEILKARDKPQPDPDAVMTKAMIEMNRQNAVRKFSAENQDVISNPILHSLARTLEVQAFEKMPQDFASHRENVMFDWDKFYSDIGTQIRSVVPKPSQPSGTAPKTEGQPSPTSEKEARKASVVNLRTASARAEKPKEEKPETRADTIAEMRKARGQPVG